MWLSDRVVTHLRSLRDEAAPAGARYELLDEIGRGGMGIVYRAFDRELEREVAVKVLHDRQNAGVGRRLLREARIIGRLEHPGIVPIHDVGVNDNGRPFYVMKRVHGERLDAWLAGGVPLHERLRIFDRLCDTVAFAHGCSIIHRDIKPANIMIGAFGEALVLDWGVAKVRLEEEEPGVDRRDPSEGTRRGAVLGTPGYMAPEQERGASADVDERADVYALGGILAHMLAHLPAGALASPALAAIVGHARAEDPANRYPSVAELAADIRRFVAGLAVVAYPENFFQRAHRVARPYRPAILLVIAYLAARFLLLLADV